MTNETNETPVDNVLAARHVARSCRKAALATVDEGGAPYVSLITLAFDHDLSPILYISAMAQHTRNLVKNPRVSLLLDGTDGLPNPQTGPRVTLVGEARRVDEPRLAQRFIARIPGAAMYTQLPDFAVWRIDPAKAHFVGGFGRALWIDSPFGLDEAAIAAFIERGKDATDKAGCDVIGIDPDGYDIIGDAGYVRVNFAAPAATPEQALERIADAP
jgi:putative heme iron utilization protein